MPLPRGIISVTGLEKPQNLKRCTPLRIRGHRQTRPLEEGLQSYLGNERRRRVLAPGERTETFISGAEPT
jgi:hypothetical protein